MIQQHMSTQDSNFESFALYATESLVSLQTYINVNHVVVMARINHMMSAQEKDFAHYERFYCEMCDLLDSQYHDEGQGWHKGMPRRRGRR